MYIVIVNGGGRGDTIGGCGLKGNVEGRGGRKTTVVWLTKKVFGVLFLFLQWSKLNKMVEVLEWEM